MLTLRDMVPEYMAGPFPDLPTHCNNKWALESCSVLALLASMRSPATHNHGDVHFSVFLTMLAMLGLCHLHRKTMHHGIHCCMEHTCVQHMAYLNDGRLRQHGLWHRRPTFLVIKGRSIDG